MTDVVIVTVFKRYLKYPLVSQSAKGVLIAGKDTILGFDGPSSMRYFPAKTPDGLPEDLLGFCWIH